MTQGQRNRDGFTIVELLVGIILTSIFSFGLYAALISGLDIFNSQQTQGSAQADARLSTGRFAREARQAVSPGPGVSSIERLGPTEIVLYVDNTRDVVAVVPRPAKVRYRLLGGELLRDSAPPVGATAPFTYGAYVTSEVVAKGVVNIPSTQPIFKAVDLGGSPMPSSVSGASAANIGTITYHLVLKQKTQNANTTMEITTDVTPRNR